MEDREGRQEEVWQWRLQMWTAPLLGLQRAEMDSFHRRQEQPGEQGNESRENGKARENVILKTQRGLRGKEHTDWSLRREGGI